MQKEAWERAIDEGRPWTDAEARRALAACEGSGMSTASFARQCNVTGGRFYWWRKHLREREAGAQPGRLVPVKVVAAAEPARRSMEGQSRVVLTDGRLRLEIEGMSPEWVAALVRLMRESEG